MIPPLNNVTTQDRYTDALTLRANQQCSLVNVDVSNAAIYLQLGTAPAPTGAIEWGPEEYLPACFRSMARRCVAARVRSAVPGTPAQVTLRLVTAAELP